MKQCTIQRPTWRVRILPGCASSAFTPCQLEHAFKLAALLGVILQELHAFVFMAEPAFPPVYGHALNVWRCHHHAGTQVDLDELARTD